MPLPAKRVFLSAQWRALAMLNWEVDPQLLTPYLPKGVQLDFHQDRTYVSLVGFLFLDTYLLGLPIPLHRHFEEVNLRYYVRREVAGEVRRGVAFVREIVPRLAISTVARWAYNEPYVTCAMRHTLRHYNPRQADLSLSPQVRYEWRDRGQWLGIDLQTVGPAAPLVDGSHAEFIAEHYWGYCPQRDGSTVEYQVEHPRWKVWQADRAEVLGDVAAFYPAPFAPLLRQPLTSAFLADGSAVKVFQPVNIGH